MANDYKDAWCQAYYNNPQTDEEIQQQLQWDYEYFLATGQMEEEDVLQQG